MARTRGSIGSTGSGHPKAVGKLSDYAVTDVRRLIMKQANPVEILWLL